MFFILSKIFKFFLLPLSWICTLWLLALVIKNKTLAKRLSLVGFLILITFSNRFIAETLISPWQYSLIPVKKLAYFDVAVVLGGGASYKKSDPDRVFLNPAGDRVMQPVVLYKQGKIGHILYSGGAGSLTAPKVSEANEVRKLYKTLALPVQAITYESQSRNTYENAAFSSTIIKKKFPNASILLVTSTLHMRRSLACFAKQGISCTPFPVNSISYEVPPTFDYYFVPDLEALNLWNDFFHEFFGWLTYLVAGYI